MPLCSSPPSTIRALKNKLTPNPSSVSIFQQLFFPKQKNQPYSLTLLTSFEEARAPFHPLKS
jgi:hypothetical protein